MPTNKSLLGIGLAAIGRPEYINIRDEESRNIEKSLPAFRQNAYTMLDYAYKNGIRYFDTAPSYGYGELFLQEWHNDRQHQDVILGTKWGYTYMANWQLGYNAKHEIKEHSLDKLNEQWATSKNLLPHLKFYQIHSATFESGVLENEAVHQRLHNLKMEHGLFIGLSSSGSNQKEIIAKALEVSVAGITLFDSFQVTYNMLEQDAFELLQKAKNEGKKIIIKEALANGRVFPNKGYPNYAALYKLLIELGRKYGVGIDAVALRFCMDSLQPDVVLSGASTVRQLEENLKIMGFVLDESELLEIKGHRVSAEAYWLERKELGWG